MSAFLVASLVAYAALAWFCGYGGRCCDKSVEDRPVDGIRFYGALCWLLAAVFAALSAWAGWLIVRGVSQ